MFSCVRMLGYMYTVYGQNILVVLSFLLYLLQFSGIHGTYTVPLKSKLTLETRTSRLDPRASMLETFEYQVSSLEDGVSRIEKQGFLEYAKTLF